MKRKFIALCLALTLCLGLAIPATAAGEQEIVVNGEAYTSVLGALLSQEEDQPITLRLDTDVQLVSSAIILGESDYGGLFDGMMIAIPSHDVTIDLNGHTLTGEQDCAIFEVQSGYTLTITDSSAAQTGKLVTQGTTTVAVQDGGVYHALPDGSKSETPAFLDVAADSYCAAPVAWAVEQGVTTGTSATTFSPDETCTNAQIITFMWRAAGSPEPTGSNPFTNLSDTAYYYKAARWAAEKGLLSGSTFDADQPCTRAMTMEYFWKQAGSPNATPSDKFTDVSADASYASAVAWAVEKGVTTGTGDDTFSPDDTCTRGQIVTFLYRDLAQ